MRDEIRVPVRSWCTSNNDYELIQVCDSTGSTTQYWIVKHYSRDIVGVDSYTEERRYKSRNAAMNYIRSRLPAKLRDMLAQSKPKDK